MSKFGNNSVIHLQDKEKDLASNIIKEESTNEISQAYKVSLEINNNSSILYPPLFSPSINELNSYIPPTTLNISQKEFISAFKSQIHTKELQKKLVGISKDDIDKIIKELSGIFRKVIKSKNGNYFFSSLIRICSQEQRIKILLELSNTIYEDCNNEFGTHPIQNLIEFASSETEFKLILSSFNDFTKIILASMNQYGNYVIRKIFEHIPESSHTDFNSIFVKFSCFLSRDIYGVCVVKTFIANTKDENILNQFFYLIMTNFINISENKYGNYLIQYLLEKWWNKREGQKLKYYIISKFDYLSKNNYSAYVCNLYLQLCGEKEKKSLITTQNKKKKNDVLLLNNNDYKEIKDN